MATLLDVTNTAVSGNSIGNNGGYVGVGQSFTPDAVWTVDSVTVPLLRGGGTANVAIQVRIETDNAGDPSGTLANASSSGSIATFTDAGFVDKTVNFTPFTLTAGTKYWLVLKTAQSESNGEFYRNKFDNAQDTYAGGGNNVLSVATWGTEDPDDMEFTILGSLQDQNKSYAYFM